MTGCRVPHVSLPLRDMGFATLFAVGRDDPIHLNLAMHFLVATPQNLVKPPRALNFP
jgi:hypothetical protein